MLMEQLTNGDTRSEQLWTEEHKLQLLVHEATDSREDYLYPHTPTTIYTALLYIYIYIMQCILS